MLLKVADIDKKIVKILKSRHVLVKILRSQNFVSVHIMIASLKIIHKSSRKTAENRKKWILY